MEQIKLKDVMDCFNKGYMKDNFVPIQFFKTDTRMFLEENKDEEYICINAEFSVYQREKGLILTLIKKTEKNYSQSIVNANNIRHLVDRAIFKDFYEMEMERGDYDNEERYKILEEKYYNLPVFYKLGYRDECKTIWATKNRYRTKLDEAQCMRFYFCINDCKHCKYWDKSCINVVSDNYGHTMQKDECFDFVDIEMED